MRSLARCCSARAPARRAVWIRGYSAWFDAPPPASAAEPPAAPKRPDTAAITSDLFTSIFGASNPAQAPPQPMFGLSGLTREQRAETEEQRMRDVDAIFESLFGKAKKRTEFAALKFLKLYPPAVRRWVTDAKAPAGMYDKTGTWQVVRSLEKERPNNYTPNASLLMPHRLTVPADLEGKYRFGVTEEDLKDAPDKLKDVLSFKWANQKEISSFRYQELRKKFGQHELDTGSVEVQLAQITVKIRALTEHMRDHHKDKRTKRSLAGFVSQRIRMMRYLKRKNVDAYYKIITHMNVRDLPPKV